MARAGSMSARRSEGDPERRETRKRGSPGPVRRGRGFLASGRRGDRKALCSLPDDVGLALIAEIVYAVGMTKTTTITIAEYMNALSKGSDSHERNGQFAFNLLYRLHPALADYVVGERYLDPFYNDDNLPAFFYFLVDEWDNF
jgi:hypothetical protein